MITIDEINTILDEISEEIPELFFRELDGGICLSSDIKLHEADAGGGLVILGEYCRSRLGRYIVIYYGSIMRRFPDMQAAELRPHLKKLLLHEFTHHLESLAGEHGLEYKDAVELARFKEDLGI